MHVSMHTFPVSMEPTEFTTAGGVTYDCVFSIVDDHRHVTCTPRVEGKPTYDHKDYSAEMRSGSLAWDRLYGVQAGKKVGDVSTYNIRVLGELSSTTTVVPKKHVPTIDSWIVKFGVNADTLARDHQMALARIAKEMDVEVPVAHEWIKIRLKIVRGLRTAEVAAADYVETPMDFMDNLLAAISWMAVTLALFAIFAIKYPFRIPLLLVGFFVVGPICLVLGLIAFHFGRRFDRRALVRKFRQLSPGGVLAFVMARTNSGMSGLFWDGVLAFLPLFRPAGQSG
jgi:hypothetical protein